MSRTLSPRVQRWSDELAANRIARKSLAVPVLPRLAMAPPPVVRDAIQLTARQHMLLTCIYEVVCREGRRPPYRELAGLMNIGSVNAVVGHLNVLAAKGYISLRPNGATKFSHDVFTLLRWPDGRPFAGLVPASAGGS